MTLEPFEQLTEQGEEVFWGSRTLAAVTRQISEDPDVPHPNVLACDEFDMTRTDIIINLEDDEFFREYASLKEPKPKSRDIYLNIQQNPTTEAGFMTLALIAPRDRYGRVWRFLTQDLTIHPQFRNRGLGRFSLK
jgi:hypothetical protein